MIFVFIVYIFAEGMIFFVVISSDEGSKYLKFENFITFFYLFYYLLVEVLHAKYRNYQKRDNYDWFKVRILC
jgi:hypothetical protein